MLLRPHVLLLAAAAVLALTACSAEDTGAVTRGASTDPSRSDADATEPAAEDAPGAATPAAADPVTPFTAAEVDALFVRSDCARCHGPGDDGPAMTSVAALVNVPSGGPRDSVCAGSSAKVLVAPGRHDASLLYRKLAGTQDCGRSMPRGSAKHFTAPELARLAAYIDALK